MRTFIEDAMKSPDNFEKTIVSTMDLKSHTPFNAAMNTFLQSGGDSFFTDRRTENRLKTGKSVATKDLAPNNDELALASLSEDVKRDFAANLLRGAVEGLEYVQKNQQALEQSVKEMQEVKIGQTIDHFYKPEEMQELKDEMAKLDVKALKNGLDQRMNEVTQSHSHTVTEERPAGLYQVNGRKDHGYHPETNDRIAAEDRSPDPKPDGG